MSPKKAACPLCSKEYASRKGLKKHLVGVHHSRYDIGTNIVHEIQGEELQEALRVLRNMKSHKKTSTPTCPVREDSPGLRSSLHSPPHPGQCEPSAAALGERGPVTCVVPAPETFYSTSEPPALPDFAPVPVANLSIAQCDLPENSIHTDDINPSVLNLSSSRPA